MAAAPVRTAVDAATMPAAPATRDFCRSRKRFVDGAGCWSTRSWATFLSGAKDVRDDDDDDDDEDDVNRVRTTSADDFGSSAVAAAVKFAKFGRLILLRVPDDKYKFIFK